MAFEIKISDTSVLKEIFGADIKYSNMRLTNVALYSITCRDVAKIMSNILASYFPSDKKLTITDANACVGGNAISFLLDIPNIEFLNCIEIDDIHSNILEHNIKNITSEDDLKYQIFTDNYINLRDFMEQDILFLDPPWSPYYQYRKPLHL